MLFLGEKKQTAMKNIKLVRMEEKDVEKITNIIRTALSEEDAEAAKKGYLHHFFCAANSIDDGRKCFNIVLGNKVIGTTGLHHYTWGPKENVWGGWLAVDPEYQGNGYGFQATTMMVEEARKLGYKHYYYETSSNPNLVSAVSLYKKLGFSKVGQIDGYMSGGADMLVYGMEL